MVYDRNTIKERVIASPMVEAELKTNIEHLLKKCGIFCRVFSRTKSASSLEHKLASGKYGGEKDKKIQDLIGIRVNLYFQDDLSICKQLFESAYEIVFENEADKWSETDVLNNNFEAAKINGVFKLPEYLIKGISDSTWDMGIDKTFEIQLKTVFFEGWHEIEHDFRYKFNMRDGENITNIWDEYNTYSRQFNSVVATLELCDNSVVNVLEEFAHKLYKDKKWDMMIRMHYRVRVSDQPLYDGIADVLSENNCYLGKKLYKAKREKLIEKLKTKHRNVSISVNMIIALLNEEVLENNPDIERIMLEHDVFNDGVFDQPRTYMKTELKPLKGYCVFQNKVLVKYKNHSSLEAPNDSLFERLCNIIHKWMRDKFKNIFTDIPKDWESYENVTHGYQVRFNVSKENLTMKMYTSHLAQDIGGRMWDTEVELAGTEKAGNGIWMIVKNLIYTNENVSELEQISRFSYPGFYKSICSDEALEIYDVGKYGNQVNCLRNDKAASDLIDLLQAEERQTPVVLLASPLKESILDEAWLTDGWLYRLLYRVKHYAHVYRCSIENITGIMDKMGNAGEYTRGVYVFWPKKAVESCTIYSQEEIKSCKYSRYRGVGAGMREDLVEDGADAFLFMLEDTIKACIENSSPCILN